MLKQITMALLALFLCANVACAQDKAPKATAPPDDSPKLYRPAGCDTLLFSPIDSFLCSCNCATFNSKWVMDQSGGLNIQNLQDNFDIEIPNDVFQSGRLIGLDSHGNFFTAMYSVPVEKNIVTTTFTWEYKCRSGAFFYKGAVRKVYRNATK